MTDGHLLSLARWMEYPLTVLLGLIVQQPQLAPNDVHIDLSYFHRIFLSVLYVLPYEPLPYI